MKKVAVPYVMKQALKTKAKVFERMGRGKSGTINGPQIKPKLKGGK